MAKLIIVRHGQSVWNLENRFTGWTDVPLSKKGINEAKKAGNILKNIKFDLAFTSMLDRAQETLRYILDKNENVNYYIKIPLFSSKKEWYNHIMDKKAEKEIFKVYYSEKLNERFYGDITGINKDFARKKYGVEQVHIWRRSYDTPPPNGEDLKANYRRTIPFIKKYVEPELMKNKNVLIVAHGNSLRALIKYLEKLNKEEIMKVEIPTGVPIYYEIKYDKKGNFKIVKKEIMKK